MAPCWTGAAAKEKLVKSNLTTRVSTPILWGVKVYCIILIVFLGIGLSLSSRAAESVETIPIELIRPGMKGYGLTVFSGFKIERFNVEVIDVVKNFLPRQDIFLVRIQHPTLSKTGIVGGMSGSPIYLEGKLAGALAYGWRFSKEPVCGITPIKNMLELVTRKRRGPTSSWAAFGAPELKKHDIGGALAINRWSQNFSSARNGQMVDVTSAQPLTPLAIPLQAAGFPPEALSQLKESFQPYGFEPLLGGGTGQAEGPDQFQPGSSLAVQLVSGDMALSATGTVTWVKDNNVLAFGHRMLNAGELYLPAVTAKIHHTLASWDRSFKISSPGRVLGTLVQDRQAGIFVDANQRIGTIPMSLLLKYQGQQRLYKVQLARHRLLTPNLVNAVLMGALSEALSDVDLATFRVLTHFSIKGYPPLQVEDYLYSTGNIGMVAGMFSRGLRALREVLSNDFEPAFIERVDLEVDVKFATEVVEITSVRLNTATVNPGSKVNVLVNYRPFGGQEFTQRYSIQIPMALAGSLINLVVAGGTMVQPDRAIPQNMRQFLADLQDGYSAKSVVVSLETPFEGIKMRGRVLRDLPLSVIDTLNTSAQVRAEQTFHTAWRQVYPTSRAIVGKKNVRIRVRSEVTQ
jgi:hypothetical protein